MISTGDPPRSRTPSQEEGAATIAAEWRRRGIDPETIAMRRGTAVATRKEIEPAPADKLLPLLSPIAFEHALRSWEGNTSARAGLARALAQMAAFELARGAPDVAEIYLRELSDPPAELALAVKHALADKRSAERRLSQFEHDQDLSIGERERRHMVFGFALAWGAAHFGASAAARHGITAFDLRSIEVGIDLVFGAR